MSEDKGSGITGALKLPLGLVDRFGNELNKQRVVEGIFRQEGFKRGYTEIETPMFEKEEAIPREFFSCWKKENFVSFELGDYRSNGSHEHLERINGGTVVLRPEGTLPVCRWLAGRLIEQPNGTLPAKLIYSIPCFRNETVEELNADKLRQFGQLGVEFMGSDSLDGDVEIMDYAYSVMRGVGIPRENIRFRLNSVAIFNNLCRAGGVDKYVIQEVLDTFSKERAKGERKGIDLAAILPDDQVRARFAQLTAPYNPPIGKIAELDQNLAALTERLRETDIPVDIDLSVVRGFSYYTGPVFQIDVLRDGKWLVEMAGGGRYDKAVGQMLGAFGVKREVPATGFAFGTERLVSAANLPKGKYTVELTV